MTQALRIEVVTDTYVPDVNGVALTLGRLCDGLRERGHSVQIIRSGKAASEYETTVLSWPLPGYWEIKVGAPWPGELRGRWGKSRPDVVYVAIETPLGFSAAAAAIKLGIPVVGGFHTNFGEYLTNYGAHHIGRLVWRYQHWFHERLDRTLVPSPEARDKLVRAGFTKVTVLGRGVDTEAFSPAKRCPEFRRKLGLADETPLALIVGRVSAEKNIGLALRAFSRMREICPEMVCMVVGDGPVRAKLKREHPEVIFPGYLLGNELATCYASADIMLFPSETETFGNVLIEGMASGVATLAYDCAAAAWHGTDGVNLMKVAPGDEAAFIEASVRMLDRTLRVKLASAARVTATTLGWPAIIAEMDGIFHEVISHQ